MTVYGQTSSIYRYNTYDDKEPIFDLDDQFAVNNPNLQGVVFDNSQLRNLICFGDDLTVFNSINKDITYKIDNLQTASFTHWKSVKGLIF